MTLFYTAEVFTAVKYLYSVKMFSLLAHLNEGGVAYLINK